LDPFDKMGQPSRIIKECFMNKAGYEEALRGLEAEIYKVV
jgi:hypothetical protein